MRWDWRKDAGRNSLKILIHILFESSVLASWYIALEGDPLFWPLGIASAFAVHFFFFQFIDFLHEHHHHHKGLKEGHANHKNNEIS